VAALVSALAQLPTLKELNLKGNACQSKSLQALSQAMKACPRLTFLEITNDKLTEDRMAGLTSFLQSLSQSSLQSLSLGEYMIVEEDMRALVESLRICSSISHLSLLTCGMTWAGIQDFAQHLQTDFGTLTSLAIPGDAVPAIDLQRNTSLQELDMENRTPTLDYYLDLNRGGRRVLQQQQQVNDLPSSLWPLLLQRAQRLSYYGGPDRSLDVLYCLLRSRILLEHDPPASCR
jgi:hypothetical protein